jgi:signal transduction histidine kinase/DNA-binding response OmpR family regulator
MLTPLRILIAEDRPADAELMVYELSRSGFEPKWTRVETEEEYLKELKTGPDVVLADHTLPAFGAPRALELLKKSGLDTPLIVVTGSISEETAVERIKQGASDYILKDRMARLGPAVKRALEEKKLRDEKRKAEELTHRNLERIRALHEINVAITTTLDLRTMLNVLLDKVELFLPFPSATTVRLLNRQTGMLESLACRNLDEEEWRAQQIGLMSGRAKTVVETKAPVIVGNIQTDPRTHNRGIYLKHGLVSYAGVPLIAKGEVLGVLGVYTKKEHEFTDEEIGFLKTLADQAAIAIHNAQLYDEMAKSNKVKDEFLSVMSHELRTPVTIITGYTALIQDGMFGEVNQEMKKALSTVISRADDLLGLVDSILEATTIETGKALLRIEEVDVKDFVQYLKSTLRYPLNKDITVQWDYSADLPVIKTDAGKLKHILQNLIDNAIKFTEKGFVTIAVNYSRETQELKFSVADTGIGISPESWDMIFEKFVQADSSSSRPHEGVGLGLYIVKKLTELLGGTVEVKSELGKGSCFTAKVPTSDTSLHLRAAELLHKKVSLNQSDTNMLRER